MARFLLNSHCRASKVANASCFVTCFTKSFLLVSVRTRRGVFALHHAGDTF